MDNPTLTPPKCPPRCNACGLRKTGAFMPVSKEELAFIEAFRTGTSAVQAGGTILYEQKPNGKLFTLYSGWAFRYKTLSDGRRQILNFLLPGDFIGLQQKFADGAMHGIEAVTDVSLCVFPRDGLWELYRNHPSLGYDITWLAAREEGIVDDHLLTAGRRNATERVAMLLMHLYRRLERVGMAEKGWTHWACHWCTPTRHSGACASWVCTKLKMAGSGCSIRGHWSASPTTTTRPRRRSPCSEPGVTRARRRPPTSRPWSG
jgi:CRP-like cAMP-binding protein